MKQIKFHYIIKLQRATIRLFTTRNEIHPDKRAINANERAIKHWLDKITDDKGDQRKILEIVKVQNWSVSGETYKTIYDKLRALGYEIFEGNE